jgi:DNA-binding CsgD family transcriptional regulator
MPGHFDIFSAATTPFAGAADCRDYLRQSCDQFGALHLSYWHLGASVDLPDRMLWLSTYCDDYTRTYMREFSPLGDPGFRYCFRSHLPIDWDECRRAFAGVRRIHEIAESFGIGRHGISIPIRDAHAGCSMFSANFHCEDRAWPALRQETANSLMLFAYNLHMRMRTLIIAAPVTDEIDLSPREREVLNWAADGKTSWETAQLLRLSERAVRLYTENAMNKLHAKTKTQAVAIAVRNGILS